eukprot:1194784-Prorocentrum_minimum.AAC.1
MFLFKRRLYCLFVYEAEPLFSDLRGNPSGISASICIVSARLSCTFTGSAAPLARGLAQRIACQSAADRSSSLPSPSNRASRPAIAPAAPQHQPRAHQTSKPIRTLYMNTSEGVCRASLDWLSLHCKRHQRRCCHCRKQQWEK